MSYNAWFSCINGCPGEYSLLEIIYRCPACGDLLEVQHDMDALRSRSAAAWMQLFDDRYRLRSASMRSEEHTSELQSQFHLVCRLLLEKKKKIKTKKKKKKIKKKISKLKKEQS